MNFSKENDNQRHRFDSKTQKHPSSKYEYEIKDSPSNKAHSQLKSVSKQQKAIRKSEQDTEENESLFKNMEKCNQKMEYYKLMGSLQQQKRTMLQQQNKLLKEENEELKEVIQGYKKELSKLSRKVDRLSFELQKYEKVGLIHDRDFLIEIPGKNSKPKSKKKQSPSEHDESLNCEKCLQLSQKLEDERNIYEKDRKYLKEQLQNLSDVLDQTQRQHKILKTQLQKTKSFDLNKQNQIVQVFKNKENALKKELTLCYKAFEEKCRFIQELELKLDYFEEENHRVLKLLSLFDNQKQNDPQNKLQNFPLKRQHRAKSSYQTKGKNFFYSALYNDEEPYSAHNVQNTIENRKKTRKCGSIQKIDCEN